MSRFALVAVEKDYKVNLSEGKVTVGRGPFLQASLEVFNLAASPRLKSQVGIVALFAYILILQMCLYR